MWIGATDQIKEGDWKWTDCSPWSFTKWGRGEPNNDKGWDRSNGEDCAILASRTNSRKTDWLDTPCTQYVERNFVCSRSKCSAPPGELCSTLFNHFNYPVGGTGLDSAMNTEKTIIMGTGKNRNLNQVKRHQRWM